MADIYTFLMSLLLNPMFLIVFLVAIILISLVLSTLFLMLGLGAVGGKNREFGSVFVTALIGSVLGWIPCVGCILYWYMIKTRHETSWGGAIAAWLLAGLIPLAIAIAIFWLVLLPFVAL
ncbi:MAG: hypothetical protein WED04_08205 [Promethearchaeati archaeon SRVP18_Atabeyarchaeia-1]